MRGAPPCANKNKRREKSGGWWDLRACIHEADELERRRDCADLLGHPIVVGLVFALGMLVFFWGLWAAASYLAGREGMLGLVWWQSSVAFVFVTVIAFGLPYRLRFGCNLYGVIFVLLLVEWAILSACFPIARVTAEHVETVRRYARLYPTYSLPTQTEPFGL